MKISIKIGIGIAPFPLTDKAIVPILPTRKSDFLTIATNPENTAETGRISSLLKQVNRICHCRCEFKRECKRGTPLSIASVIKAVYEEAVKVGQSVNARMLEYPEESFFSKSQIMSVYFRASFDKGVLLPLFPALPQ